MGSSIEIDMLRFGGVASSIPALLRREEGLRGEGSANEARRGDSGRTIDVLGTDREKLDDPRCGSSSDVRNGLNPGPRSSSYSGNDPLEGTSETCLSFLTGD